VPPRGVGDVTQERLAARARELGQPLSAAVESQASVASISTRARDGLDQLARILRDIRREGAVSVRVALEVVLTGTDYIEYACRLGDPRDRSREENIQELVADASQFDQSDGGGLSAYLAKVGLMTSEDRTDPAPDAISLMTLHSAKGLEFDHVFLIGLEQGLFPHERSLGRDAAMEEERRLFYVGLTRARKRCFVLHATHRTVFDGDPVARLRSEFIGEIPAGFVELAEEEEGGRTIIAEPSDEWLEVELAEGDRVYHETFGSGRLLRLYGRGANRKATVFFPGHGEKTLLVEMARLVRTEDA
jgi:DNA helicase-2/ATP-dependent DNA helicase PcrA